MFFSPKTKSTQFTVLNNIPIQFIITHRGYTFYILSVLKILNYLSAYRHFLQKLKY